MPKCRYCKKEFQPRHSTTERECSPQCSYNYLTKTKQGRKAFNSSKAKLPAIKKTEARKAKRELDRNTLSWQFKKTQIAFNKMRRLQELKWFQDRNQEPECISCGKTKMDWCCGHFVTAGSSTNLRFEEKNTFLQCNRYCNMGLSGNRKGNKTTRGYEQGLRDRFGEIEGNEVIDWCETNQHKTRKFTCEELEKMRAEFSAAARKIESELSAIGVNQ